MNNPDEGAVGGAAVGEIVEPLGGGIPGAVVGGYIVAHIGFIDGTIKGAIAAGTCQALGVY